MASPIHKSMHQQHLNRMNGNIQQQQQQRMPLLKPQLNSQPQMRLQNPQQRHHPQQHHPQQQQQQRAHNPPQRTTRLQTQNHNHINRLQAPSQKQDMSQNFSAPSQKVFTKQTVDVAKDTEKLKHDQERLSNLHSQLYNEAEKIRVWKSEKELEIKQKGRSLSDALQTIDNLRKSIIELQFQNDEYSTKLNEKEKEKEETEQKLSTVREMANVLRDQMVQLEHHIEKGVQDKDSIARVNEKMLEENQGLVSKFKALDISQGDLITRHSQQVQSLKEKYDAEIKALKSQIYHLENQVISIMDIKKSLEENLKEVTSKLDEITDKYNIMEKEYNACQSKLQQVEQLKTTQEEELTTLKTSFEDLSKRFEDASHSLAATSEKLTQSVKESAALGKKCIDIETIYSKEINSLQSDIKDVTLELQENQKELSVLTEEYKKKEEKLALVEDEKEIAIKLHTECEEKIEMLQKERETTRHEKDILSEKHNHSEAELADANKHITNLQGEKQNLEMKITELLTSVSNLNVEKESLNLEMGTLHKKIDELQKLYEDAECIMRKSQHDLHESVQFIDEKTKEISHLTEAKCDLEKSLEKATNVNAEMSKGIREKEVLLEEKEVQFKEKLSQVESLNKEVETLKEKNSQQEEMLQTLQEQEQEHADTIKTELAEKEKQTEDLGHQTKSLQGQINVKTKQVKNLEKENKTLKTQIKNKTDKLKEHEERLTTMEGETNDLQGTLKEKEENIQTCQNEMKLAKDNFDVQQKNFCSTLEEYKIENDNIVACHVKENRVLQMKLEELQKKSTQDVSNLMNEAEKSKTMIDNQTARIVELEAGVKEITTKDTKLLELTNSVESTNANLQQLSIENQRIKDENEQMKGRVNEMEGKITEQSNLQNEVCTLEEKLKHNEQMLEENSTLKEENLQLQERLEKLERDIAKEVRVQNSDRMVPTTPRTPAVDAIVPITPSSIIRNSQGGRGKRILFTGLPHLMDVDEEEEMKQKSTPKTPKISRESLHGSAMTPKTPRESLHDSAMTPKTPKTPFTPKRNVRLTPKPNSDKTKSYNKETDFDDISPVKKIQKKSQIPVSAGKEAGKDRTVKKLVSSHYSAVKQSPGGVPRPKFLSTKMKKLTPKQKQTANLSWFDTDNVFTFDG